MEAKDKLAEWLQAKLIERNWSFREVARRSGGRLSHTVVREIANAKGRKLYTDTIEALADVFETPRLILFRMAGLIQMSSVDEYKERVLRKLDNLDPDDYEYMLEQIELTRKTLEKEKAKKNSRVVLSN